MAETTFIILGGAGDLAKRLLIPGIAQFASHRGMKMTIIGVGRSDVPDYDEFVAEAVKDVPGEFSEHLVNTATFVAGDATDPAVLKSVLSGRDDVVLYMALSPGVTIEAVAALKDIELPSKFAIAVEKPFGEDAQSARDLNEALLELTSEDNIFRVDHFLTMSGTLNTQAIVESSIFARLWSAEVIESIELIYNEDLGLEGRAEFYDSTGAAEDMIQSHLLQTMARILSVGDETSEDVLDAVKLKDRVYRARYTQGSIDGKEFPNYVDEEGVDPQKNTETWAHVEVEIDSDRWRGVPITLESGKAVGSFEKLIRVTYKNLTDELPDRFEIEFNDDGISLMVGAPDPANSGEPQKICLSGEVSQFDFSAYGRVVAAIMEGRNELEVSRRAAEQGWELMDVIAERLADAPMWEYPAGSTREEIIERGRPGKC